MKRTLLCVAASLAPLLAHAGCQDHVKTWAQQLHPDRAFDVKLAKCKVWPANTALTIAALPLGNPADKDGGGGADLEVLVADTATGAIVAHQFQQAAIHYEADHYFDGVEIDTARYQLTPAQHAFGVRVKSSGGYPVDMSGVTTLSLYLLDGSRLHTVLDRLIATDWYTSRDGACESDSTATTRTLALGPAQGDQYVKLQLNEKTTAQNVSSDGEHCTMSNSPAKHRSFTLDYRDGEYRIPDDLRHTD
ncbi:PA3715 family protein [Paraburkholderia nodosa]|uniref:hypothetical protein n=1 Tax=Paraburkholderia nodosa TaxID=392320 RepID=UPI0004824A7D|nr:hypothetical protein [Paraburkholderia nodosa]